MTFRPEYIGEGNYEVPFWQGHPDPHNMKRHHFMIFGGELEVAGEVGEYFKRVLGAEARYEFVDSTTAELCKYMENAFLATKVTFCNEFYEIAKALGVNYDVLREMWLLDGRIGRSHTAVFKESRFWREMSAEGHQCHREAFRRGWLRAKPPQSRACSQ